MHFCTMQLKWAIELKVAFYSIWMSFSNQSFQCPKTFMNYLKICNNICFRFIFSCDSTAWSCVSTRTSALRDCGRCSCRLPSSDPPCDCCHWLAIHCVSIQPRLTSRSTEVRTNTFSGCSKSLLVPLLFSVVLVSQSPLHFFQKL